MLIYAQMGPGKVQKMLAATVPVGRGMRVWWEGKGGRGRLGARSTPFYTFGILYRVPVIFPSTVVF